MDRISVVIIAKNEAAHITAAVTSGLLVSTDIIVVDSGSTDGTKQLAEAAGARVIPVLWQGFGNARNTGAAAASRDNILNLDADELITPGLAAELRTLELEDKVVYGFRRKNFIGEKEVRNGEWGNDTVYRVYNRNYHGWTHDKVHEQINAVKANRKKIGGAILHYTTSDLHQYSKKLDTYATLSAEKFYEAGKKVGAAKPVLSATFSFIKNYLFRLGFLDGKTGFDLAWMHTRYNWNKYQKLRHLCHEDAGKK